MQYELFETKQQATAYNELVQQAIDIQRTGIINGSRFYVNVFQVYTGQWAVPVPDEITIEPQGDRVDNYPEEPPTEPEGD